MSIIQLVVLLAAVFASTVFSTESVEDNANLVDIAPTIVNGNDAQIGDYPSYVALFSDSEDYGGFVSAGVYCGATLLDSQHLLTAAHCMTDFSQVLYTQAAIMLDNTNDYSHAERHKISELYIHPNYTDELEELLPYDIAILKLATDAVGGEFVQLASSEEYRTSSAAFSAIGLGNTRTGFSNTTQLQQTSLSWVNNNTCQNTFLFGDNISGRQICFTGNFSFVTGLRAGICQGDSGGPVYWRNGSQLVQVGLASFGPEICGTPDAAVSSVFTEITDYTDWIESVIAGEESPVCRFSEQDRVNNINGVGSLNCAERFNSDNDSNNGGSLDWYWMLMLFMLIRVRRYGAKYPQTVMSIRIVLW